MKANYILGAALVLGTLSLGTSCENYFDEKYMGNGDPQITDVRTGMSYELTDDDYKLLTTFVENKEKALALDPVDSTGLKELMAIATEKSFTETASADMYVPALMQSKFPYLDNGTTCDVLYTMREGKSSRVKEFTGAQGFALTTNDYETIWQKRGADYLTPATVTGIPAFLSGKIANAKEGQIALISYVYSEDEPDPSELSDFLPYELTLSELLAFPDEKRHQISGIVGEVKSTISGQTRTATRYGKTKGFRPATRSPSSDATPRITANRRYWTPSMSAIRRLIRLPLPEEPNKHVISRPSMRFTN